MGTYVGQDSPYKQQNVLWLAKELNEFNEMYLAESLQYGWRISL